MKILWFSWKDLRHPLAGGAEVVANQICSRAAAEGHEVILLCGGFKGSTPREERNGYTIIRVGQWTSVYWEAYRYYKKHLRDFPDLVIEEINTVPFFTQFYVKNKNRFIVMHQIARVVWFYQIKQPISTIGYLLEPLYLRVLSGNKVITISRSSKEDFQRYGFKGKNIQLISMGVENKPAENLEGLPPKYERLTILSLGAIRPMKRTHVQLEAFELMKPNFPDLQLKIAGGGSGPYMDEFLKKIEASPYRKDIEYIGRVSEDQKCELMRRSHLILVTSVKEGWGLIITEANSQGTPAAVLNVDGLRDAVFRGETGLLAEDAADLALQSVELLKDQKRYAELRLKAWEKSKQVTYEQCYADFKKITNLK
jgi:glycosyltransferase involved in cell wall biosynthesis